MFDDEKIKLIEAVPEADMILVIWIKLLTLAGKKNMNGYIFLTENIPYTEEMLSTLFNRPINTVRLALETFKSFGMINYNGEGQIKITNWEKHQNIDGLERIKELARARQSKYTERKKQKALTNNDVITTSNDDTRLDIDKIREDKKENIKKDKKESSQAELNDKKETEFSFTDKCWYNLEDWQIKMWQSKYPMLTVNYELQDLMKSKLLQDPEKYKILIKNKYSGDINKFIWAWLEQSKKLFLKNHHYKEGEE